MQKQCVIYILNLQKCINFEIEIDKKYNFVTFYHSTSQSHEEFKAFYENLERSVCFIPFKNPFLTVLVVQLNAKSTECHNDESTTNKDNKIHTLVF